MKFPVKSLFFVGIVIAFTPSAQAYIDPGSGMLLWQGIIAAVGALLIFIKSPLASIKSFLSKFKGKQ